MIDSFRGRYRFLSNFYPSPVELDKVTFPTLEHAYQAAKTDDPNRRTVIFMAATAAKAKQEGRYGKLRPDWEEVKVDIMTDLVRKKFADPDLARRLDATGDEELVEGNDWGDTFWGRCNGIGQNMLGRILMQVRDENRHRPRTPEA